MSGWFPLLPLIPFVLVLKAPAVSPRIHKPLSALTMEDDRHEQDFLQLTVCAFSSIKFHKHLTFSWWVYLMNGTVGQCRELGSSCITRPLTRSTQTPPVAGGTPYKEMKHVGADKCVYPLNNCISSTCSSRSLYGLCLHLSMCKVDQQRHHLDHRIC